jgi:hypothetical protein
VKLIVEADGGVDDLHEALLQLPLGDEDVISRDAELRQIRVRAESAQHWLSYRRGGVRGEEIVELIEGSVSVVGADPQVVIGSPRCRPGHTQAESIHPRDIPRCKVLDAIEDVPDGILAALGGCIENRIEPTELLRHLLAGDLRLKAGDLEREVLGEGKLDGFVKRKVERTRPRHHRLTGTQAGGGADNRDYEEENSGHRQAKAHLGGKRKADTPHQPFRRVSVRSRDGKLSANR